MSSSAPSSRKNKPRRDFTRLSPAGSRAYAVKTELGKYALTYCFVTDSLVRLGIKIGTRGFEYLKKAVLLAIVNPEYRRNGILKIYEEIRNGKSVKTVGNCICDAISEAAISPSKAVFFEYFADDISYDTGTVSNARFIKKLANDIDHDVSAYVIKF